MHLASSAKIVSVDTLDVIAANVTNLDSTSIKHRESSIELIAPILDAKRGQFYIAVYQKQKGLCHEDTKPVLTLRLRSGLKALVEGTRRKAFRQDLQDLQDFCL